MRQDSTTAPPPAPVPDPSSHLALSILTTIFCCLPIGIVSLVYSLNVRFLCRAGQQEAARRAARNALRWNVAGIVLTCVLTLICTVTAALSYETVLEHIRRQQKISPDAPAQVSPDINY